MFQGSGFGAASTTTPFGQASTFGKPASSFTAPVFGSTGSLFGQTTQPQTSSLFGNTAPAPAFGQPQTTQPSFGAFPATGTTSLFGNQQNAAGTGNSIFGSSGSSAFGQAKPTFSGFPGQTGTTSLFGQQPQAQGSNTQTSSLFGQTTATPSTGLFGSSSAGFGSTAGGGTTVKFTPVTGTDTMVKNGVTQTISTRHHCITCMKEYESKSLEELRLEDYAANRKGPQQGVQATGGLFGSTPQPSLFGSPTTTNQISTGTSGSIFGGFNTSGGFGSSGSLFGKTGTTSTGFGSTTNTANQPSFGFNTSNTTTNNPFGANTAQQKPFGVVSAQPSGGLFGNTSQPSNVFGSTGNTGFGSGFGAQPNQAMGGGLFNQNKPAFQLGPTAAPVFSFGQPSGTATNTTTSQPLFGSKPAGTSIGTPIFGSTAPNTASTFGSNLTFGQNNQQSLFGNFNKPATPGYIFGQNQTTSSTLGSGLNLGGNNIFGTAANKPGSLFGSNASGGLFGTPSFGTSNSLTFGSNTSSGLGGNPLNLGGSSLLGNSSQSNQSSNNPLNQHIIALASVPFGDSPLFKNLLPVTGKTDELLKPTSPAAQKAILNGQNFKVSPRTGSKIKVKPIGQSNLTKKSLFDGLEEEDNGSNWQTKASPKRLVLKPKPSTGNIGSIRRLPNATNNDEEESSVVQLNSPRYMHSCTQDANLLNDSNTKETDDNNSTNQKTSSSVSTSQANASQKEGADNSASSTHPRMFSPPKSLSSGQKSQENSVDTIDDFSHNHSHNSENKENIEHSSSTTPELEESVNPEEENLPPHPTGIRLHRVGYYTIPNLDELSALMDSEGRCIVENFTIGRLNYGNVFYPDSFDVAGLNLDEIVHIRHKEVVVYPDDSKKPPVGEGLNRRAQVTLDRVWPLDRATRDPISDPEKLSCLDYESKLRNASAKNKTRFVEYRSQTGSWVFKVDHFSKYGLSDSDEEDPPVPSDVKKLKLTSAGAPFTTQAKEISRRGVDIVSQQHQVVTNGHMNQNFMRILDEDDQEMSDTGDVGDGALKSLYDANEEIELSQKSPSAQLANDLGASSHKVQLMKQSFYHEDDDYNFNTDYMEMTNFRSGTVLDVDVDEFDRNMMHEKTKLGHSFPLFRTQFKSSLQYDHAPQSPPLPTAVHEVSTPRRGKSVLPVKPAAALRSPTISGPPPPVVVPQSLVLRHLIKAVPWGKSTAGKLKARCLADLSLNMGHRFRVGWGPSCSLISLTTEQISMSTPLTSNLLDVGLLLAHRNDDDFSPFIIQRLQLKGGQPADNTIDFQETIEEHLDVALNYSIIGEEDGCPVFAPAAGNAALHAHCRVPHSDPGFESIWELCVALWGDLPDSVDADEESHQRVMDRKKAVSTWLETYVNESVKDDLAQVEVNSPEAAFALLTGHQIYEACKMAQDMGDHYASLLVSQVGTGEAVRTLAEKQLCQWVETQADKLIDCIRLKLIMLVAGIPLLQATETTINIFDGLDWKRAFALHLWYVCSTSASVTDALLKYESAFDNANCYAASPLPSYSVEWETTSGQALFDVSYHLLCLFSFRSHPLERLLNPATHTSDPIDYRLSWLLMQVLEALGYTHLSELSASHIHVCFAAQLESHGLWHWAVFVLLHIKNKPRRQSAVMDMIGRHATLNKKNALSPEELFLLEKLNVPKQWLFQAKATLALSYCSYEDAAVFLLEAEEWNKSHEIIMKHIAAKAIINEEYEYIETLLKELAGGDRERARIIFGWAHQGALLWDYLVVVREVSAVIENRNPYALEKLQPQLASLCSRIALLPTMTPVHRLCQAEIAKRTAHLVYNLFILQRKEGDIDSVCRLAKLITQLPLPEDYSHQEMHQLVSSYLNMCL
ncbi:nuclear pore complex protein Nup98-96 [Lycorma delicatula]|uniref:nuclear pore complex protein Nup98-96 n=1 Tax=Lycorma delicatula TaxID=130591 RepID=UPI003F5108DC